MVKDILQCLEPRCLIHGVARGRLCLLFRIPWWYRRSDKFQMMAALLGNLAQPYLDLINILGLIALLAWFEVRTQSTITIFLEGWGAQDHRFQPTCALLIVFCKSKNTLGNLQNAQSLTEHSFELHIAKQDLAWLMMTTNARPGLELGLLGGNNGEGIWSFI
jgi:hypothetical protein